MTKRPDYSKARLLPVDEVEAIGRAAIERGDEPTFQLANEVMGIRRRVRGGTIVAESMVSAVDGQGRVRLTWHDETAFLELGTAIGFATSVMEAAAAARIDAQLFSTLQRAGVSPARIADIVQSVRADRARDDDRAPS